MKNSTTTYCTILIVMLFMLFTYTVNAQEADKTVSLVVTGQGKTPDEAKQSALRSAIEQAFGAFISSKTEILNDQVIADQIASVSNGNIQSFSILNESQLPDGSWGVTLKALVSVSKLTSFVESKGIAIEIKGGLFALNIKQQLLNEQGEINAVNEMVGLLHETMQTAFDYVIRSDDPKSLDAESKNWAITVVVTAITNKNFDFCANYCIKTLAALTLSSEEVASYKRLNKPVFPIVINYNGVAVTYYLRKEFSINTLMALTSQWEFYTRLFTIESGMDKSNGAGSAVLYDFAHRSGDLRTINFLPIGYQAANFTLQETRTLSQIEQMTGYTVKPRGVISQFKLGGIVVYEINGHGLIAAMSNFPDMNGSSAKSACDELILNGYTDWHLPTKEELNALYRDLKLIGLGDLRGADYWSSTESEENSLWTFDFLRERFGADSKDCSICNYHVRAVRTF